MAEETAVGKVDTPKKLSLLVAEAARYSMEVPAFLNTIKATVFPKDSNASDAQVAAFLAVAHQYGLNPFTREIYAFPTPGGGICPIVGVDGWMKIINSHPQYDGMESEDLLDKEGKLQAITVRMFRKDRNHHMPFTARMSEFKRDTSPWKNYPSMMLLWKAIKGCARINFGFAGLYDEEEAAEINITSVSTEIERKTNDATEAVKEKITRKKAEKEAEKAAEAQKAVVGSPTPPAPAPDPPAPSQTNGAASLFDSPPAQVVLISEEQRQKLLEVCKRLSIPPDTIRSEMKKMGIENSRAIKASDFPALMGWAENYKA
jgi:phage recombination protein Bet